MQKSKPYLTPEEYLKMERVAEAKGEYYKGEIFAFAGASFNHNKIAANVLGELTAALKNTQCFALTSDMRVWAADVEFSAYPDATVVCGEPEFHDEHKDWLTNPLVIIEVLSKSTGKYDQEEKFRLYRSLASFKEYVLIDQYSVYVQQFWKTAEDEWKLKLYEKLSDVVAFKTIAAEVSLKDIYRKVEF